MSAKLHKVIAYTLTSIGFVTIGAGLILSIVNNNQNLSEASNIPGLPGQETPDLPSRPGAGVPPAPPAANSSSSSIESVQSSSSTGLSSNNSTNGATVDLGSGRQTSQATKNNVNLQDGSNTNRNSSFSINIADLEDDGTVRSGGFEVMLGIGLVIIVTFAIYYIKAHSDKSALVTNEKKIKTRL